MKRKYQILPLTSFLAAIFLLFLTSYAPAQDSPFTTLLRSETQRLERIIKNFESIDQALFDNDLFFRDAPGGKVTTVKKSSIEWVLSQDSSMHAEYKTTDQKWRQQLITRELPALLTDFRQVSLELRRNIRRNNYPASDTDISLVSQLRNKLKYFYIRKSVRQKSPHCFLFSKPGKCPYRISSTRLHWRHGRLLSKK